MMTNVWTDENAKGLFYAQCACRAALGPARELPPPPIVPALDLLPVFYRSSGTGVGRLVALRLCQPRYIFMVRPARPLGGLGPVPHSDATDATHDKGDTCETCARYMALHDLWQAVVTRFAYNSEETPGPGVSKRILGATLPGRVFFPHESAHPFSQHTMTLHTEPAIPLGGGGRAGAGTSWGPVGRSGSSTPARTRPTGCPR